MNRLASIRMFGLLAAFFLALSAMPCGADGMASKLEEQGHMNQLRVTDLRSVNRNGLLNVQAEVTNIGAGNQRLFYRFKWLDDSGFSVWDEEPWKPVVIYGKQRHLISVVAPTPQATDFRLVLQSPDNSTDDSPPPSTTWPNRY